MNSAIHKNAMISEGLCKQLVASYLSKTRGGSVKPRVALRELINTVYAQGHQAGVQSVYKEVFDE